MKKWISLFLISTISLTGCAPKESGGGVFSQYFVEPFTEAITFIAELFGENYGIAIIFITLALRVVIMPFMLKTFKNSQDMRGKMDAVKPELNDLQSRLKQASSQEDKKKIQSEMMELYRTNQINPLNMGCLPIVLQIPIFAGIYYAIRSSEEIATHSFLWFDLGQTDLTMAVIAGVLYFIQYRVSLIGMPEEQRKQMKWMGLLSPVMILFISISSPSALPLYWAAGGAFLVIQTLISKKLYTT
ncbi:MAG: membrane protein insertase YidC [Halobacillus sp.]|uniref:membrane protein insertase YidC n=1 Tax=Halobacillus sp. TaxID=56800 RepID=UPI003BB12A35